MPVSAQHLCTRPRADVTIPGIATGSKKLKQPAGAGPPAGDAVERVDIGHAVSKTAAPSESHSHCKKKVDKPSLVILKVNSKRERSLRALVDCGASNNFVRLQSLARLDFEEVEPPRSLLEVRLATGVVVRTEKRVIRARFSYEEKKFVDELIVLDLNDKFDMVLGMPWLHGMIQCSTGRSARSCASGVAARQRAMTLSAQHMHLAVHATPQQRQREARLPPIIPREH
ncbi:unnamed protein product [Phytophthora fragariaefolia]|uniref:Unnamed protein product n=1 Tax=Phytophthora fragariaefolia TaxID=1490495 RepID=A0A9W7DBL4_9STRA|nr:unnamed protein product [Phytophthora fragariaefolia]